MYPAAPIDHLGLPNSTYLLYVIAAAWRQSWIDAGTPPPPRPTACPQRKVRCCLWCFEEDCAILALRLRCYHTIMDHRPNVTLIIALCDGSSLSCAHRKPKLAPRFRQITRPLLRSHFIRTLLVADAEPFSRPLSSRPLMPPLLL